MKRSLRLCVIVVLGLSLVAAACGDDDDSADTSTGTTVAAPRSAEAKITIGAQDFGESAILAEIYKQGLEAKGYKTSVQKLGGLPRPRDRRHSRPGRSTSPPSTRRRCSSSSTTRRARRPATPTRPSRKLEHLARRPKGLEALESSEAVDTNAFVDHEGHGRQARHQVAHGPRDQGQGPEDRRAGGLRDQPVLRARPQEDLRRSTSRTSSRRSRRARSPRRWTPARSTSAVLFSTDGRIAAKNYVLLEDDKHMLAADNVVVRDEQDLAGADGRRRRHQRDHGEARRPTS